RFNSGDKAALIYTSPFPYLRAFRPYGVHYINTLTPPKQIIERLLHRRPRFLISYPSVLMELITLYPNECRAMGLRAVSTNSEQSSQQQRDAIAEAFGCPVFDEYSTEELILGGFQCAHKLYHLQEDCAYIEALVIN